jgi:hypothetical protein
VWNASIRGHLCELLVEFCLVDEQRSSHEVEYIDVLVQMQSFLSAKFEPVAIRVELVQSALQDLVRHHSNPVQELFQIL